MQWQLKGAGEKQPIPLVLLQNLWILCIIANLTSILIESLVVKIARRNDFLTHEEKFFGINEQEGFIESECEKASCMFQAIQERGKPGKGQAKKGASQERGKPGDIQSITIYGELFGGNI